MAPAKHKPRAAPIGKEELIEFLSTSSDFAFELQCLERLSSLGFHCQHGGSYSDPVTKKGRQFDIRARSLNENRCAYLAVECKSLSESHPLLAMCVPRSWNESFHELVLSFHPDLIEQKQPRITAFEETFQTHRITDGSEYAIGAQVAKACGQVGWRDGSLYYNDDDVFGKWSQALASADDLACEAAEEGETCKRAFLSLVLPVLVVPDGMLWMVEYEIDGAKRGEPAKTDRCSYFVGNEYSIGTRQRGRLVISHLEFVTLSGLEGLVRSILAPGSSWYPNS